MGAGMGQSDAVGTFRKAVALAASLVEGTATTLPADDADAVHDPLVAAALFGLGRRDPVFARKLMGRHGAWLEVPATELMDLDDEALASAYARRSEGARPG